MKYLFLISLLCLIGCGPNKPANEQVRYLQGLIHKVGIVSLPYRYDLAKRQPDSRHEFDRNSMDSLFFDGGNVGGVLPDTSSYYAFLYYTNGDSFYPYLVTIDQTGKVIDRRLIAVGACGALPIEVDSCVDLVSINTKLEIDLYYKMRGRANTNDSIPVLAELCNRVLGKGRITEQGQIELTIGEQEDCQ